MTEEVLLSINGFVAEIVLNRPRKLNAVTPAMAARIESACAELDRNDHVRVVLVRGASERAFSAGSDLSSLAEYKSAWEFRNRVEYATAVRNLRKPVIAALRGWVLGGGAEMALSADIRVAGRSAKIGFPEVTRGWVGGGGASQMLPRLVGYGQAMQLLLTGEPVEAEVAFRLGLVELVVEDAEVETRARDLCEKLASFSPVAVASVKASVRAALSMPLAAGLAYENEMNTLCFAAGDHREGIRAFEEKRPASFSR
ncbi:MAG: enoyl-CoA hydratase/isomerase family protein [Hyphomicrobiales bacterium]|nr:enoyl-CoA hydratase/isomerase family protein [Hyphomicrobiales bacterium]MBV9114106.1 enoyl-CoA hydratase/isomerase family protein [Hyphomicrobiales bacterium]MBV9518492.1 enoyl-CoA hydratase/isomerase family protein [Hyphomicrobiales bacterium]